MRALFAVLLFVTLGCQSRDPTLPTTGTVPHVGEAADWLRKHQRFVEASRSEQFDVIAFGDSLLWGWDDHRELWRERVINAPTAFWAIGGDATNQLLWRLDHGALAGQKPKLVILLVGINNLWVNPDAEDIATSIGLVLVRIRVDCPTAKVLLLGVLHQGHDATDKNRKRVRAINARLPQFADDRTTVLHDLAEVLLEADGSLSREVSSDGTHLTRLGYERFAEALKPTVQALLK